MDWLEPTITSAGVLLSASVLAWWQYGGKLAARRRKLTQELELYHQVPAETLETEEGQAFANYLRWELDAYREQAVSRSWWDRLIYGGVLWLCPWAIYTIWNDRVSLAQSANEWLDKWLGTALFVVFLLGCFFIVAGRIEAAMYSESELTRMAKRDLKRLRSRPSHWWRTGRWPMKLKRGYARFEARMEIQDQPHQRWTQGGTANRRSR